MGSVLMKMICNKQYMSDIEMQIDDETTLSSVYNNSLCIQNKIEILNTNSKLIKEKVDNINLDLISLSTNQNDINTKLSNVLDKIISNQEILLFSIKKNETNREKMENILLNGLTSIETELKNLKMKYNNNMQNSNTIVKSSVKPSTSQDLNQSLLFDDKKQHCSTYYSEGDFNFQQEVRKRKNSPLFPAEKQEIFGSSPDFLSFSVI